MNKETALQKAFALYQNGSFASKSAQKQAIGYINRAYEITRNSVRNQALEILIAKEEEAEAPYSKEELFSSEMFRSDLSVKIRTKIAKTWELPLELRHIRERHSALIDQLEIAEEISFLLDLLEEFKAAPIAPVQKDDIEERALESLEGMKGTLEEKIAQAVKPEEKIIDNGFRSQHWISVDVHHVTNFHGTSFLRRMFFLNGVRVALQECLSAIGADLDFWIKKGSPDLGKASREEIRAFYN